MRVPDPPLTLHSYERFHSQFLPDDRDITVFVPPGYDDDPERRFPVLYLHDGQNLFDPEKAFKRGEHWRVGETADGAHRPLGASNRWSSSASTTPGRRRLDEYTPDRTTSGAAAPRPMPTGGCSPRS